MATKQDLELAKRLMAARVLDEDKMRVAFEFLARLQEQGKSAPLEAVLYHQGVLPRGSLAVLRAPPILEALPFEEYRGLKRGEGIALIIRAAFNAIDQGVVDLLEFDDLALELGYSSHSHFSEAFKRKRAIC